ncbi:hypothetical protein [Aquimarina sp. I32.4]|uniref:hypothetical protein n=1 Tax=Aquimarina sp. I32.4 TaxID=2053903 RepID=UPI001E4B5800|nr:hypothetical protein [Aquimarina sp. I32.4]
MEKTNAVTKNSELTSVLNTHFQGKINLARIKLIALFISSLCKVQSVTSDKLANAFDTTANTSSSLRRISSWRAVLHLRMQTTQRRVSHYHIL